MTNLEFTIIKRLNNLEIGQAWNYQGTKVQYRGTTEGNRAYHVTTFEGQFLEYQTIKTDVYATVQDSIFDYEIAVLDAELV